MQVKGEIIVLNEVQNVTDSFKKREVVIRTDEQYPQEINIETHQDKTSILDSFKVGDVVNVSINLRGRKWTSPQNVDKWFNTIVGWRVELVSNGTGTEPVQGQTEEEEDEVPF